MLKMWGGCFFKTLVITYQIISSCNIEGHLFSLLYRTIDQDIYIIKPTICTSVFFVLKSFTLLKLFYTY